VLWRQHSRQDAENWDARYVGMMITYNKLSGAADYEAIGDDDLYLVENLDLEEIL